MGYGKVGRVKHESPQRLKPNLFQKLTYGLKAVPFKNQTFPAACFSRDAAAAADRSSRRDGKERLFSGWKGRHLPRHGPAARPRRAPA